MVLVLSATQMAAEIRTCGIRSDRAVAGTDHKPDPLAHLALGQRSLESDIALGTLVNVAIPLLAFPIISAVSGRNTNSYAEDLRAATVGTSVLLPAPFWGASASPPVRLAA